MQFSDILIDKLSRTEYSRIIESHATPLDVQCQIKALPEYAPRLALGITPEAKA